MPQFPKTTLAILAGGKATRMGGQNKALLEIDGESFIKRIYRNLSPLFQNTIILSNTVKDFNIAKTIVYSDIIEDAGPLGGIHSALVHSIDPAVFIVSCDMPFADSTIVIKILDEFQIKQPEILVPVINSLYEPLFAIYSKHLATKIELIVSPSNGKPVKNLLDNSNTFFFNLPDNATTKKCFTNINSLEDLNTI